MIQAVLKNLAAASFPKTDPNSGSNSGTETDLDNSVSQVIHLAHEARQPEAETKILAHALPDFQRVLRLSGRWLLVGDILAFVIAFLDGCALDWAVQTMRMNSPIEKFSALMTVQQVMLFFAIGAMGILWLDSRGHYRQRLPFWEMVGQILAVASVGFIASGFILFASKDDYSSRLWMGISWVLFAVLVFAGRNVVRHILAKGGLWQIPALIIGDGATAGAAQRALGTDPQMGFSIVGQVPSSALDDFAKPSAWKQLLMTRGVSHVFLALEGSEIERHQAALKAMTRARVPCTIVPPWLGLPCGTLSSHHFMMQDVMLLHDTNRLQLPLARLMKRMFDVAVAGTALLLLSPVFLAVALGVRRDGGPALFKQARVGHGGRLFNCYKFRSMRSDAEAVLEKYLTDNPAAAEEWATYQKLKHDVRITTFGQFIRRTSLDELPQLINVLKGDMSLVGPRPCMPGQESLYAEDFSFYEAVSPGITGPWQVSGRSKLSFKERVELEAWYSRNWNLWMDIVIMLKTVPTVLGRGQAF
jgi:Undecaprenyl-phosphate galactose phosphotransferase WbaP